MGFKIFRLWQAAYSEARTRIYRERPELAEAPYETQMAAFFAQRATYSDYFTRGMERLGHEVFEVVFDLEIAQRTWAREHGITVESSDWRREILLHQIAAYRPEILYLHSVGATPKGLAPQARKRCPTIKLVVGYTGVPVPSEYFAGIDLVLTAMPVLVDEYGKGGLETHLVYHGFDPSILELIGDAPTEPRCPFAFVGSSGFGHQYHFIDRFWMLAELMIRGGLQGWINDEAGRMPNVHGADWSMLEAMQPKLVENARNSKTLDMMKVQVARIVSTMRFNPMMLAEYQAFVFSHEHIADATVPMVPLSKLVPDACRPPVFGLEMYKTLKRIDVLFNLHGEHNRGNTTNMRMFEATGVGSCLLTDEGPNVRDLFEPGREIVTYSGVEDCIEKARYLMDHDAERKAIADAGHQRTLRDHTTDRRCEEIDAILSKRLN